MARPVTVFTVSQFDGETMERTLAFSSYEKAYLDMKNEYLNYLDVFKEASITVVEHYIDDTSAMIRTEEGKEVWHLEEVVVDSFMEEREEHRNFHATITVPQMIANRIQKAMCWEEGDPEAYRMGEEETISYTATFENGYQMDIKCCGVKYEPQSLAMITRFFKMQHGRKQCFTTPLGKKLLVQKPAIISLVHGLC